MASVQPQQRKMAADEGQVNVIMVSLPYQGHINPMLRFAKCLTSKGLHVTLATTEVARHRLVKDSSDKDSSSHQMKPLASQVEFEFFEDGLASELDRDKNLGLLLEEYLPSKGADNLSNLITELGTKKGKKFSCIIINCFVPWVVDVAGKHNIPCGMVWVQACTLYAIYYRYHRRLNVFPPFDDVDNELELPATPLMKVADLPTFILPSGPQHFNKLVGVSVHSLDKLKWVFSTSFQDLELPIIQSMASHKPILPVGPLISPTILGNPDTIEGTSDLWATEDSCIDWLDTQPPSSVLYISLGSISVFSQLEAEAIATALDRTKVSFLWVMKPGEEGWDREAAQLPTDFLQRSKGRGLVVSWAPQDRVLIHPSVAFFLTHCGWNSTLETVAAGVPVIAYPDWTDQPTNAKLLVDVFGMGVRMKKGEDDGRLSADEVERCILEVRDGPKALAMKMKGMELKEAARKAVAPGGSSDQVIDNFIGEITAQLAAGKN